MSKEDIIRKLTSRKFWLAVALFVSGIITSIGGANAETTAQTVSGLIMQGAAVIAYIIGEGIADSSPTVNEDVWYVDGEEIVQPK